VRVLYFGTYERAYPRNAQVMSCLRRAGVEVVERHEPVWDGVRHKWNAGVRSAARLALAELRLLGRPAPAADAVVVGYPGHPDLPAARRAARGRPVVFDPLVSLADTFVGDRGRFRPGSLAARTLVALDRYAFRSADLVVADTAAHAEFLSSLAGHDRFEVCFVGAEERVFGPPWEPALPFTCLFVAKLSPLHGVETIAAAARLLPAVRFRIVGSGQAEIGELPANVERVPWIGYERLGDEYRRAGCALGVFGTSAKASRVIPTKAFHALACGTPLVTADTPAARELLENGKSALLVPAGDAGALAEAVGRLATDQEVARRLSEGGRRAYRERASEEVLASRWRAVLERVV
jgi:glycosyltransferase involved in cell wall biosynthesis